MVVPGSPLRCSGRSGAVQRLAGQACGSPGGRSEKTVKHWRQLILLGVVLLVAADWPQFRGPGGTAASSETGLPVHWSNTDNVRWKVELPGRGLSNPVIAAGRI